MKQIIYPCFLICLLLSCNEKTSYQSQLMIKNETGSDITVKLYPKSEYQVSESLYKYSDFGSGARETQFEIEPEIQTEIYTTKGLDINPCELALQIFDSIHIEILNPELKEIKFSPDTVIGYSENIFSNTTIWYFELNKFDLPTMFQSNPVESNDYIISVIPDKFE